MEDEIYRLFNEGVSASLEAERLREEGNLDQAKETEEQACSTFDRILELDPEHLGGLSGKALSLSQLGQVEEAAELFQEALSLEPNFPENHRQLGHCFMQMGDWESCRQEILIALEQDARSDYRQKSSDEVLRYGGYLLDMADEFRRKNQMDKERACQLNARWAFWLAQDIDPENKMAAQEMKKLNRILDVE